MFIIFVSFLGLTHKTRIVFMVWVVSGWFSAYGGFLKRYPYCRHKVWALIFMDYFSPILDIYVYLTMNNDNWLTRAADAQDVKVIDDIEKIEDVSEISLALAS